LIRPRCRARSAWNGPRNPGHGDYASTVALQAARKAGVPPRELGEAIAGELARDPAVRSAEVAGPGFVNIALTPAAAGSVAGTVVEQGASLRLLGVSAPDRL
jgi:arginyl-tRNA synthetase